MDKLKLADWVLDYLPKSTKIAGNLELDPLTGDAGFRQYFRLNTSPALIAVNSPPDKENNSAYIDISLALKAMDIIRPRIYAVDYAQGFLLLEDFGNRHLHSTLSLKSIDFRYDQAEEMLLSLQKANKGSGIFPVYDEQALSQEFDLFATWFVDRLLGLHIEMVDIKMLAELRSYLVNTALSQPQVLVHRDYHSRNLMVLSNDQLGMIDFQDAVIGPITYDLVSLLKDCYISWPRDMVIPRVANYKQKLTDAGLLSDMDSKKFLGWFDLMGLQRHIKVLGIFARLALRDEKSAYLKDLPLVIGYVLETAAHYPQTAKFSHWFDAKVMPKVRQQKWFDESHFKE
ncbi:MAG: phosphotransferase [Porticoccaceae bacterium]|nr:phosphotransferase [Porticoccaceae bacterium]